MLFLFIDLATHNKVLSIFHCQESICLGKDNFLALVTTNLYRKTKIIPFFQIFYHNPKPNDTKNVDLYKRPYI
jgi:hypothetical protein